MNTRMKELAARREALVAEAVLQRTLAGEACARLHRKLRLADRGLRFVRSLRRKPMLLGLGAAVLTLLTAKPRRAIQWFGFCLSAYSMFKRANRWLAPRRAD